MKFNNRIKQDPSLSEGDFYYRGSRQILQAVIEEGGKAIIALNGGCIANQVAPTICNLNLEDCRCNGALVLLLPSPFHWVNRRILFKREKSRGYFLPRERAEAMYEQRIKRWRQSADLITYGMDPRKNARVIIRKLAVETAALPNKTA